MRVLAVSGAWSVVGPPRPVPGLTLRAKAEDRYYPQCVDDVVRGRYRSAARATPKPTKTPPDPRIRRRASRGRRSTPPVRASTREYKVRDANPSAANVTPSSAGSNGEDPAGMN